MKRIGIDVGGTNTDAVLIDGDTIVASIKVPTTQDVLSGVKAALAHVSGHVGATDRPIDAVMIGTTHFTNAVVERARLERVAAIRIALPTGSSLPPMCDWPKDLYDAVDPLIFMVHGGHEYDGSPLVPMIPDEIREAAMRLTPSASAPGAPPPSGWREWRRSPPRLRPACPEPRPDRR